MVGRDSTEVLVVGAGPVGLFTALLLAQRGISVRVVDKKWHPASQSYALAIHARTLELLGEAGVGADVLSKGIRVDKMSFFDRKGPLGDLSLQVPGGRYSQVIILPQSELEAALERKLKKVKGKVLWNHEAARIEPEADGVNVEICQYDRMSAGYPIARTEWVVKKREQLKAQYVVGADGYFSTVRNALQSEYRPTGAVLRFAVYEFETEDTVSDEIRVILNEQNSNVLWPINPHSGRWNFEIRDEADHVGTLERLLELAQERAPWVTLRPKRILWTTSVTFQSHLVTTFGKDRIWLAGDAAHLTGPVGAQSINVGLREARLLADSISGVLRGTARGNELASYGTDQMDEWQALLGLKKKLVVGSGTPAWVEQYASRLLPALPASGEHLKMLLKQLKLELR